MKLLLTIIYRISVQNDNELYDRHITPFHSLQYNSLHYHTKNTLTLHTLTKISYNNSISHHTYPLCLLISIPSHFRLSICLTTTYEQPYTFNTVINDFIRHFKVIKTTSQVDNYIHEGYRGFGGPKGCKNKQFGVLGRSDKPPVPTGG